MSSSQFSITPIVHVTPPKEAERFFRVARLAKWLFLVYELVAFRTEAWKHRALVVAALGDYLENIDLWSSVAQNISFHNAFEI